MRERRHDRRNVPRTPISLGVELRGVAGGGDDGTISTQSMNISAEGVYCTVPRFIAPLTRLALAVVLPPDPAQGRYENKVIQCEGVAVRSYPERESAMCNGYEVACYFTSMAEDDRRALTQYLGVTAGAK